MKLHVPVGADVYFPVLERGFNRYLAQSGRFISADKQTACVWHHNSREVTFIKLDWIRNDFDSADELAQSMSKK